MKNTMKNIWNMVVLHKLNGKIISRWDFGEELDKAIDFVHDAMEECDQIGHHHFEVINELNGQTYYNQRFTIDMAK